MLYHLNVYVLLPPTVSNAQVQPLKQTPVFLLSFEGPVAQNSAKHIRQSNSRNVGILTGKKWDVKAGTAVLQLDFTRMRDVKR